MPDRTGNYHGISRWFKEPFPALSHAFGAALSIVGLIFLLSLAGGHDALIVAFAIYGTSLILLYAASAAAHAVHCSPKVSLRFDQLDYMAIFVLIAGTYTPICLGPLWGPWGWTLLSVEWGLAAVGIITVLAIGERAAWLRIAAYGFMGWMAVVAAGPLSQKLSFWALVLLITGGVIYSLGAIVFATNRPRLWPGRFGAHDLWHCMVLAGSGCHFALIAAYVAV